MTATEVAAVVAIIVAVAAATIACGVAWSLARATRQLRAAATALGAEAADVVDDLRRVAREAEIELGRAEGLLERAEGISTTLEDASRLTYLAVSSPIIKVAAAANGVRRGAGRLRRGPAPEPPVRVVASQRGRRRR